MTETLWDQIKGLKDKPRFNAVTPTAGRGLGYIGSVVDAEIRKVAEAPSARNRTLLEASRALGRYIAGGDLVADDIRDKLYAAAKGNTNGPDIMSDAEINRAIDNGFRYGQDSPARAPRPEQVTGSEDIEDIVQKMRDSLLDTYGLEDIPDPVPVVGGYLFLDTPAEIFGPPGSAKSFMALDIAGCVGSGIPWHGHYTRQGEVLYVVAEGFSGIRKRVRAWEHEHNRRMEHVQFLPQAVQVSSSPWKALTEVARQIKPVLIILDTQAQITVGLDENSAKDIGVFFAEIQRLRAASGACVLVVHHAGKAGGYRGSSALEGAFTSFLSVEPDEIDKTRITLNTKKQKDIEPSPPKLLELHPVQDSAVLRDAGYNASDV